MRRRKIIALVLAGAMALSLAACGGKGNAKDGGKSNAGDSGKMQVAMITDSGDITDQSFNQTTYETCKAWAEKMM